MKKKNFSNFIKGSLTVLISVLIIFTVVKAGTITPPGETPSATMYTLTDIYRKLTENATFTAFEPSSRSFTFSDALDSTHYTLEQIYEKIPDINATKLLSDTTYLGVTGSIANCGSEGSQSCYAAGTYFAGTKKTLSADSVTVNAGYYDATTLSAVDADLTEGYIKKNTAIFGVTGTLYGDTDAAKVCSNASAAGTLTIDASKVLSSATYCGTGGSIANCSTEGGKTCYAASGYWTATAGSSVTGADGSISFSIPNGYYSGNTCTAQDSYLVTGNIRSTVTIFGVAGNSNVVDTSSGNAVTGEILSGQKCWVDGSEVTGSISNCGSEGSQSCYATGTYFAGTSKTPSSSSTSQSAGYYPAFDLATVDTDLVVSNIGATANIFGVAGTLLKNVYNGSATSGATDYAFWTQALGGVDDYNDAQTAMPTGSYVGAWTDCTSGADNYCGLGATDTNADAKDNSTGLIWSIWLDTGTTHTWFWANNCQEPADQTPVGVCAADGDDGCQCQKKTSSKVGCEALGDGGWRLPYQKELMQAYINGSSKSSVSYLSNTAYFYWSATTTSYSTHYAWLVTLNHGSTNNNTKVTSGSYTVRCVR